MNASELIKKLQDLTKQHGDLPVSTYDANQDGEAITIKSVSYLKNFYLEDDIAIKGFIISNTSQDIIKSILT